MSSTDAWSLSSASSRSLRRFSSCERAFMDSSVRLADIRGGCRRTGRRGWGNYNAAGRTEIGDEKRADFIGCGIVCKYDGKGNDAQRSRGDARLRRRTHGDKGGAWGDE